jgi:MFS family permease
MLPPMRSIRAKLRTSGAAFAEVFRNRNLRFLELGWAFWILGHWAYLVAVSVYAYGVGGETAVGIVFLLRLVPAAIVSPFTGLLGDRFPRETVLIGANLGRITLIGSAAVGVLLDAPAELVFALAVVDAIVATPVRSAQAALVPSLARGPAELTAANAVARSVESFAVFGGPALAGLLFALMSTGAVFVVTAAMLAVSVALIALIKVERQVRPKAELVASTILSEAFAGFRAIGSHPSLRVMMVLITAQTAIAGALQVYIVVIALDLLTLGDSGVGFLNSAMGIGALAGAVISFSLVGARRLSPVFIVGITLLGLPLIVIGLWPVTTTAVVALGVFGLGSALVDVSGLTIVQRSVPEDVLARVFGVIQMLWLSSMGLGAFVAPLLIGLLGTETAIAVTGAVAPILVLLLGSRVVRIDAGAKAPDPGDLRILSSVPIFAPLPGASLEHLAGRLTPLRLEAATTVVRQGDAGDRFFIVVEGALDVAQDGSSISELGPGDFFGEIALLRDLPRTATVTARTPVVLYALDRDDFLAAVTSHAPSAESAEEVVSSRLAGIPVAGARLPAG